MGRAIELRTDYTSATLRLLAKRGKDTAQTRRLLAIAAVLDGASRAEAAKAGGMDRQTLRDWVIRFNEQGPDGLISKLSSGAPGKLTDEHKGFLAQLVEEGPIPASHGVVRWRACDLIMQLHEKFGISVSDDTVYRALKELGFSHVSARPKAYKQDPEAMQAFKKYKWWMGLVNCGYGIVISPCVFTEKFANKPELLEEQRKPFLINDKAKAFFNQRFFW